MEHLEQPKKGEFRYTGYLYWKKEECVEEIDVNAKNVKEARRKIKAIADEDYLPGYKLKSVIQRNGIYI